MQVTDHLQGTWSRGTIEKDPLSEQGTEHSKYGEQHRAKPSQTTWRIILQLGDCSLLLISCLIMALFISSYDTAMHFTAGAATVWHTLFFFLCLTLVSWHLIAGITQAYDPFNTMHRLRGILCVLLSHLLMLIIGLIFTFSFALEDVKETVPELLCFLAIATPLMSIWRAAFATFMNLPRFHRQSVIVGINTIGEVVGRELRNTRGISMKILGYINDALSPQAGEHHTDGLPILGGREILQRLANNGVIDTIIMAVDHRTNPDLFKEALDFAQLGVEVVPITTIYERIKGKLAIEHIGDHWYTSLPSEGVVSPFYLFWQKILDTVFGLIGLIALLLVLPVLAPLIYFDSPGPIFYTQERLGYKGRKFRIYKFRSMHANAESQQWTTVSDRRVTHIGAFMRATHLDELPQLLNILRGDMSLIGPRPERPEFVSKLAQSIPFYRIRLSVKPGLTGWAQVKYRYGNTNQDALIKLQYDLYYVKHRSFSLDILILLKTIVEVVMMRGI